MPIRLSVHLPLPPTTTPFPPPLKFIFRFGFFVDQNSLTLAPTPTLFPQKNNYLKFGFIVKKIHLLQPQPTTPPTPKNYFGFLVKKYLTLAPFPPSPPPPPAQKKLLFFRFGFYVNESLTLASPPPPPPSQKIKKFFFLFIWILCKKNHLLEPPPSPQPHPHLKKIKTTKKKKMLFGFLVKKI